MAAPAYGSKTEPASGISTSRTLFTPASTAIGNFLAASIKIMGAEVTVAAAGWTVIQVHVGGSEAHTLAVLYKVATEAGEKEIPITWGGASRFNGGGCVRVTGDNTEAPVNASVVRANEAASKSLTWSSLTTTVAQTLSMLFAAEGIEGEASCTPPAGYTQRQSMSVGNPYVATGELAEKGASGEKVGTLGTSRESTAIHLAIAPPPENTVYTDSGSGTVTASGESTESVEAADSGAGTATASGEGTDARSAEDSGAGTITATGSGTEHPESVGLYERLPASTGPSRHIAKGETLKDALEAASPGETILVSMDALLAPEVAFEAPEFTTHGEPDAPITLQAVGRVRTVGRWKPDGCSYFLVKGDWEVDESPDVGIWWAGTCKKCEWLGGEVHHSQRSNVLFSTEIEDVYMDRVWFHHPGQQFEPTENLDHNAYCEGTRGMLTNCILERSTAHGLQLYPLSVDWIIANNTFAFNRRADITVAGNPTKASRGARIVNNICYGSEYGIRDFWGGPVGEDNRAWNNLVFGSLSSDYYVSNPEGLEAIPLDLGDDGVERAPSVAEANAWFKDASVAVTMSVVEGQLRVQWADATGGRNDGVRTAIGTEGIPVPGGQSLKLEVVVDVVSLPPGSLGSFARLYFYNAKGELISDSGATAGHHSETGLLTLRETLTAPSNTAKVSLGFAAHSGEGGSFDAYLKSASLLFTPSADPQFIGSEGKELRPRPGSPALRRADLRWSPSRDFFNLPRPMLASVGALEPSEVSRVRVIERPPMRQYILATTPWGRTYRWGEDALGADQVIEDLADADAAPGGHTTLTGTLARKPGVDYSDMKMGTRIEVFGAGQMKVSEYRLERAPRTSGDKLVMEPAANGYQVLLSDDEGARCIPIDADMTAWGEPSTRRRAAGGKINLNGQASLLPAGDLSSGDVPSISHAWGQMNTSAAEPDEIESFYDSNGIELGRVMLDFANVSGGSGGSWVTRVGAMVDDLTTGFESLKDFNATSASAQSLPIAPGMFFLLLQSFYAATFAGEGKWEDHYKSIRVLDRSGIPICGTWPNVGVLASDVIAYILSQFAPGLSYTIGPNGTLKPSSFVISHLAFKDPTTALEIITQALRFELLEWGVWPGPNGPSFYLNQRGGREGRKRWRARIGAAKFTETGQQMDQVWNKVVVSWPDTDGTTKTIGPPGSGYAVTSSRLEDPDPLNPVNEAGESRTKHIALNDPATQEGAEETAERFLEGAKQLDGSGEATLTGYIEDEHGKEWPYYCVHGADEIEFVDSSIPGFRYIVEAQRDRKSRSVQIHIDAPPDSYQALLERIGAREVPLGLGA